MGSFWKTNPPGGGFRAVSTGFDPHLRRKEAGERRQRSAGKFCGRRRTTEMVAANNGGVSSDSARQAQHDRLEEADAACNNHMETTTSSVRLRPGSDATAPRSATCKLTSMDKWRQGVPTAGRLRKFPGAPWGLVEVARFSCICNGLSALHLWNPHPSKKISLIPARALLGV